ncbi:hypothetical protein BC332_14830 [Capsicum chinense]|nr:hypothetical protein BC332_14830 [Capsicum chinense]
MSTGLFENDQQNSQLSAGAVNVGKVENGDEKSEFWKQPDGLGYRPCLDFSRVLHGCGFWWNESAEKSDC